MNLRYRLLLGYLWHFLSSDGDLFSPNGSRTSHGWLVSATFSEMSHLKSIGELLVELDLEESGLKAGPPYELSYNLTLPEREMDRWRAHLDVVSAASNLSQLLQIMLDENAVSFAKEQAILAALIDRDSNTRMELEELRKENPPPSPEGFAKSGCAEIRSAGSPVLWRILRLANSAFQLIALGASPRSETCKRSKTERVDRVFRATVRILRIDQLGVGQRVDDRLHKVPHERIHDRAVECVVHRNPDVLASCRVHGGHISRMIGPIPSRTGEAP
ncbi:hypothetical protein [Bradyrhizobium cenepequi]|uniref:hypothetical protein n=1 Tax=Bradyrhizobium cenepequi TaxID=2821403 RepID=UPI001CE35B14|nr:hypothetical protein [Bradyrhizobium cenepequi]MCA6112194.1 hypothetical protein [Bradyrhizobium cenepequi]